MVDRLFQVNRYVGSQATELKNLLMIHFGRAIGVGRRHLIQLHYVNLEISYSIDKEIITYS